MAAIIVAVMEYIVIMLTESFIIVITIVAIVKSIFWVAATITTSSATVAVTNITIKVKVEVEEEAAAVTIGVAFVVQIDSFDFIFFVTNVYFDFKDSLELLAY